jgi:hypothetical protein
MIESDEDDDHGKGTECEGGFWCESMSHVLLTISLPLDSLSVSSPASSLKRVVFYAEKGV